MYHFATEVNDLFLCRVYYSYCEAKFDAMEVRLWNQRRSGRRRLTIPAYEIGPAEIVRLADWDTTVTDIFAKKVIRFLLNCGSEKLPKETLIAFEK